MKQQGFLRPKNFFDLSALYFLKWLVLGALTGVVGGVIGAAFVRLIAFVAACNHADQRLMLLLPVSGCLIVFLYARFNELGSTGTNMVITAIQRDEPVRKINGPLIFVSTIVSHLAGASVGKEGAALQMGGSLGAFAADLFHLDRADRRLMVMTGMSAVFGAVFGTPVGAAVFPVEMASVGAMCYTALLPCLTAATFAAWTAGLLGAPPERFVIQGAEALNEFSPTALAPFVLLGIGCALVSVLFCFLLHFSEKTYARFFENRYQRILVGTLLFWGLALLFGTAYNGSGALLIERAVEGEALPYAFLLKMLFTAVALGAGFKGGEIVPTLTIGACFGCAFGGMLGINPSFGAACGMVGLFAGVTNCPMATTFLAVEMFGGEGVLAYALVITLSYALSGYASLYRAQRFVYAKTKARIINRENGKNAVEITEVDEGSHVIRYRSE